MKATTDFIFLDAFKTEAEEYISYKRSLVNIPASVSLLSGDRKPQIRS